MVVKSAGCSPVFTIPVVLLLLSFHWSCVQSACLSSCPSNDCNGQHNPGAGYCANADHVTITLWQSYLAPQKYIEYYYTSCVFGLLRCRRSRNRIRRYREIQGRYLQCSTYCCSGYTGSGSNCQPVCTSACQNGGTCSDPDTCTCTSEWTGSTCSTPVCDPACMNDGTCSSPGACSCTSNWSGVHCGNPVCNPGCSNGGTCTAPSTCACVPQWTGPTCTTDVDECTAGTHNCEQLCTNTPGGYNCSCHTGYQLLADGYQCRDINECTEGTHDCSQTCINTEGSFKCGYVTDINYNECENNPCDHTCANNVGSFVCGCNKGYRLRGKTECINIDECAEDEPCDQICTDTEGSFTCSCRKGFELDANGLDCNDIDECARGTHQCSQNCQNSIGSYSCYFDAGFE